MRSNDTHAGALTSGYEPTRLQNSNTVSFKCIVEKQGLSDMRCRASVKELHLPAGGYVIRYAADRPLFQNVQIAALCIVVVIARKQNGVPFEPALPRRQRRLRSCAVYKAVLGTVQLYRTPFRPSCLSSDLVAFGKCGSM